MILNFQPQFPELIKTGKKIHTIRLDKHNRWKEGRIIHMQSGPRFKPVRFKELVCIGTQRIRIRRWMVDEVFIDGRRLSSDEIQILAVNDGFANKAELFEWFLPKKDLTETNFSWIGKIIHWTNWRY